MISYDDSEIYWGHYSMTKNFYSFSDKVQNISSFIISNEIFILMAKIIIKMFLMVEILHIVINYNIYFFDKKNKII